MRLVELDPRVAEDVLFMFETRTDESVSQQLFGTPPESLESHKAWLEKNHLRTRVIYLVKDHETNVGYCQLTPESEVELGWVISPRYQGMGYGRYAVEALTELAVSKFPEMSVVLYVKKDNSSAVRLYLKCGYRVLADDNNILKMVYEN